MRSIINISLPQQMATLVRNEVDTGRYGSISEFFRELVREWTKRQALNAVSVSEAEFHQGKAKALRSLADLR